MNSDMALGLDLLSIEEAPPAKLPLLQAQVTIGSRENYLKKMVDLSDHKNQSAYVCFMNVHMLMESERNPDFLKIVNHADMCCPDGVPVAKSIRWLHGLKQKHMPGPDVLPLLMKEAERRGKRVFVIGGNEVIKQGFVKRMREEYPELALAGYECPPFSKESPSVDHHLVEKINQSRADMIFVALGCPKQERWMHQHRGLVQGCMFGLGYALPVFANVETRAPRWMIENGFEWLYRLFRQPKRLLWRYAQTNSLFIQKLVFQMIRLRFKKIKRIA